MPNFPTQRSYQANLAEAIDVFQSRFPTKGLRVAGPILSMLEAAVAADTRDTQDIFQFLAAIDIDKATGQALDRAGADEKAPRFSPTASRGLVNISDSSLTKISTKVYQGKPAPIAGTTTLWVSDASSFPSTGSIYVGRGTTNLEGPVAYTAPTLQSGGFWSLTVGAGLQQYHNVAETVVLAQRGNRFVPAGTNVTTPQGNATNAVSFTTTQDATLLDGETDVSDVPVVCLQTGTIGNVPANSITVATVPAFTGMTVTNPLPLTNARDQEDEQGYRERIKSIKATRAKGTRLALTTGTLNIKAPDEATQVASANLVVRNTSPTTLIVDDGTGYEEKATGVAIESLMDSAAGGEYLFQVANTPVAKASVESTISAPFALVAGVDLTVKIGGVATTHTFNAEDFRDVGNATAFEVVASINQDVNLLWSARTSSSGSTVTLFAKSETSEDVEVVTPASGLDANQYLGFPAGRVDTVKLYRNDLPLHKDGKLASLQSNPQTSWVGFVDGDTLIVSVDGTDAVTYEVKDQDFVDAGTSYVTVNPANSLAAWATVLNAKIAGVTASVENGGLVLTSNLGANDRAALTIDSASTLVTKGMFSTLTATGKTSDFTVDRNLGQIELATVLEAGDTLAAGTESTRAYLQSAAMPAPVVIGGSGGNLWFVVDGAAQAIGVGLAPAHFIKLTVSSTSPVKRFAVYSDAGLTSAVYPFVNVQAGDWLIAWDPAFDAATPSTAAAYRGTWRVSQVDTLGQWIEIDTPAATPPGAPGYFVLSGLTVGGLAVVRTPAVPQTVTFAAGTYAAADVASTITAQLVGAAAATYRTKYIRVSTNTFDETGDISLVTADVQGRLLPFGVDSVANSPAHVAAVESTGTEIGTPNFSFTDLATVTAGPPTTFTLANALAGSGVDHNAMLSWVRALPTPNYTARHDSHVGDRTTIKSVSGATVTPRRVLSVPVPDTGAAPTNYTGSRLYLAQAFGLNPQDTVDIVLDGDQQSKQFNIPMYRRCLPDANVAYGSTIRLFDADNGNSTLAATFGQSFNFGDFSAFMQARYISHKADASKSAIWRYYRFGAEGNDVRVSYQYPHAPNLAVALDTTEDSNLAVAIRLASGARRSVTLSAAEKMAAGVVNFNGNTSSITFFTGCRISQVVRAGTTVTVTLAMPTTDVTDHQFQTGNSIYLTSTSVNFPSGFKTVTRLSTTQVTYTEAGAAVTENYTPSTSPLMFTWTATPQTWNTVADGDIAWISSSTSLNALLQGYWRVYGTPGTNYFQVRTPLKAATQYGYQPVNNVDAVQFWPLANNSVTAIVTAVNALDGPIAGTVLGTGSGLIVKSTIDEYDDAGSSDQYYNLGDGVNYVSTSAYDVGSGNLLLTLKVAVLGNLVGGTNGWAAEQIRLVPNTAKNVVDYLAVGSVTGLTLGGGSVQLANRGRAVELASETAGSGGSIQIVGGTANRLAAAVYGTAQKVGSGQILTVQTKAADVAGLSGNQWVSLDNTIKSLKTLDWTSSTTLTVDGSTGKVTVGGAGTAWRYSGSTNGPVVGGRWSCERHGRFTAFVAANDDQSAPSVNFSSVVEGDFVTIPQATGSWTGVATATYIHKQTATSTVLTDGTVLVVGGQDSGGLAVNKVEIYDPVANTWTDITGTDPLPAARFAHAASLLPDGRVLVTGGYLTGVARSTVYAYNPTGSLGSRWTVKASMGQARAYHTATALADGTVFIAGGETAASTELNTTELYTVATNAWTTVGNTLGQARSHHTATLMGNGRVLLANGLNGGNPTATADVFYPGNQTFTSPTSGATRYQHGAILLDTGGVLVAGGVSGGVAIATCKLFNPTTETWSAAATLPEARASTAVTLLSTGNVLAAGGFTGASTKLASCVQYDAADNAWTYTGSLTTARSSGLGVVTGDTVLVVGGTNASGNDIATVEKFSLAGGISALNTGTFRVARVLWDTSGKRWAFWVENDNSVEEKESISSITFYNKNSFLAGDTLGIGVNISGLGNEGLWTVARIDPTDQQVLYLQSSPTSTSGAIGLSTDVQFVQGTTGSLTRLIKRILWITQNSTDSTYADVAFTTSDGSELLGAAYGTVINALDKFAFPTSLVKGIDGYRYNTGLLGEVNRVVYGDDQDPVTYPGIAAAGSTILIQGPVVKRIVVSLAIRIRSGTPGDVIDKVRTEVAGLINKQGVGESIAISDIVRQASNVDGVLSVTVVSPAYSASQDLITVQPFEKPMVLDPAADVVVTQIGI